MCDGVIVDLVQGGGVTLFPHFEGGGGGEVEISVLSLPPALSSPSSLPPLPLLSPPPPLPPPSPL